VGQQFSASAAAEFFELLGELARDTEWSIRHDVDAGLESLRQSMRRFEKDCRFVAVGGSARAARRLVGPWLGDVELTEALRLVETSTPRTISRRFGVHRSRALILPAGVTILAQVHELLGVPLHVCDGGIREGAVLATMAALAA